MTIPKISLLVVINGPVAMAGSIPRLSKKSGINVPTRPATIITAMSDTEMANDNSNFSVQSHKNKNKNI